MNIPWRSLVSYLAVIVRGFYIYKRCLDTASRETAYRFRSFSLDNSIILVIHKIIVEWYCKEAIFMV